MVIQLPGNHHAQRMTHLDMVAGIEVISGKVVQSLGLGTESCSGRSIKLVGPPMPTNPKGQVTLDWHVAMFFKTHRSTSLVFNVEHSREFAILLERYTIKKTGFYSKYRVILGSSTTKGPS